MNVQTHRRDAENAEVAQRGAIMYPQRKRLRVNDITQEVIGAAIAVHRALGPGLLESACQECLCQELALRRIPFERELPLPLEYKGIGCECGYRLDILVAGAVVVEVKSIEAIAPIREAQLLTCLRLGGWNVDS
jgi:GxxExxY protein